MAEQYMHALHVTAGGASILKRAHNVCLSAADCSPLCNPCMYKTTLMLQYGCCCMVSAFHHLQRPPQAPSPPQRLTSGRRGLGFCPSIRSLSSSLSGTWSTLSCTALALPSPSMRTSTVRASPTLDASSCVAPVRASYSRGHGTWKDKVCMSSSRFGFDEKHLRESKSGLGCR